MDKKETLKRFGKGALIGGISGLAAGAAFAASILIIRQIYIWLGVSSIALGIINLLISAVVGVLIQCKLIDFLWDHWDCY